MVYFVVDSFAKGVDRRRPEVGALPGTLYLGEDVHITDGGTIAVRKSFEPTYSLPPGRTKGFARASGQFYVFGHEPPGIFVGALALPAGINYQQLVHPGGLALIEVMSWDVYDGKVYAAGKFSDGSIYHYYDGVIVDQVFDGRARGFFAIREGATGSVSMIKVNGVNIIDTAISWNTSHSNTAALIAAEINSYSSSPEYEATSVGAVVYVIAAVGTGAAVNGYELEVEVTGDVVVSTPENMLNGIDDAPDPGPFVKTYGTKMYYTSGSLTAFSGVNAPTKYDENAVGAGAINMSNHVSGSDTLQCIVEFLGGLAFFSFSVIQLWSMSADPELNARLQVIDKIGLLARNAAAAYGEADVYFLSARGVRSLRPSDVASNFNRHVSVSDPINKILLEDLRTLSAEVIAQATVTVDPVDGRFLLALGNRVYVLSFFPASGVSAWSLYNVGMQITDWIATETQLYARSGNVIYLYGGEDSNTYDETVEPRVKIVNLNAVAPATFKGWNGFDFGLDGEWVVNMYVGVNSTTAEAVAVLPGSTYDGPAIPVDAEASHVALEFIGRPSAREIVNIALHYTSHEAE